MGVRGLPRDSRYSSSYKGVRVRDRTDGDRLSRPVSKVRVILLLGRSAPPTVGLLPLLPQYRHWTTRSSISPPDVSGTLIASIPSQAVNSFLGNDGSHN